MTHYMNLNPQPYDLMKRKLKTIELRLNDEKRSTICVNDTIVFTNVDDEQEKLTAKVTALHKFDGFAQLYATLPLDRCGYLPQEIPTASAEDMNIYYTPEKQKQYGVVGIEIQLI